MADETGKIWIIFNGEIYNYIELRAELKQLGHSFRSNADTEVIIKSYMQWGTDCLNRFNGMWSFALWDQNRQRLFCARDRFGIKPLYYYFDGNRFLFGSEVKQFLVHDIAKEIDEGVIYKSFAIGAFTINSDNTFLRQVKIVPHSHYLTVEKNNLHISRYYDLDYVRFEKSKLSFAEACSDYRQLFKDAVKLRMRSDVEVGSTLSGGLDSSAIVTVASGYTDRQFQTFSSYYTYTPQYDERKWIQLVVDKTNSKANYISASAQEVLEDLYKIIWHHDYPLESSSPVAQYYVMQLARKHNVTVLLDGQGSDELTSGYNHGFYRYYADILAEFKIRKFFAEYPRYIRNNEKGNAFAKSFKTLISLIMNEKSLYRLELAHSFNPVNRPDSSKIRLDEIALFDTSRLSNFLYNQMMSTSIQTLLHFEDRNSMAHSIESRVPFLDYRLVELVFHLPSDFKINGNYGKFIHRESLKEIVPDEIISRKDKIGFFSPGEQIWLRNDLKLFADEIFNSSAFLNRGIFNHRLIKSAYRKYLKGDSRTAKKLWQTLMTELWFRIFIDSNKITSP
jgi:asparagine synthase (glutamine-hydrolysing)